MLMAIEKYEVRYSVLSSLGDSSLAEGRSSRFLEIQIRFTRTRASVRAVSQCPRSSLDKNMSDKQFETSSPNHPPPHLINTD
jgi:hypothetical protein